MTFYAETSATICPIRINLNINEIYLIEVVRNPVMHGELYADKKPGESITVLGLTTSEQEGFFMMAKNLDMREVMA